MPKPSEPASFAWFAATHLAAVLDLDAPVAGGRPGRLEPAAPRRADVGGADVVADGREGDRPVGRDGGERVGHGDGVGQPPRLGEHRAQGGGGRGIADRPPARVEHDRRGRAGLLREAFLEQRPGPLRPPCPGRSMAEFSVPPKRGGEREEHRGGERPEADHAPVPPRRGPAQPLERPARPGGPGRSRPARRAAGIWSLSGTELVGEHACLRSLARPTPSCWSPLRRSMRGQVSAIARPRAGGWSARSGSPACRWRGRPRTRPRCVPCQVVRASTRSPSPNTSSDADAEVGEGLPVRPHQRLELVRAAALAVAQARRMRHRVGRDVVVGAVGVAVPDGLDVARGRLRCSRFPSTHSFTVSRGRRSPMPGQLLAELPEPLRSPRGRRAPCGGSTACASRSTCRSRPRARARRRGRPPCPRPARADGAARAPSRSGRRTARRVGNSPFSPVSVWPG